MAKLVLIDGEGVAELSDGTHWCVAFDQLPQTQRWLNGAEISVTLQLRGSMWPYALTHQLTGQAVCASNATTAKRQSGKADTDQTGCSADLLCAPVAVSFYRVCQTAFV